MLSLLLSWTRCWTKSQRTNYLRRFVVHVTLSIHCVKYSQNIISQQGWWQNILPLVFASNRESQPLYDPSTCVRPPASDRGRCMACHSLAAGKSIRRVPFQYKYCLPGYKKSHYNHQTVVRSSYRYSEYSFVWNWIVNQATFCIKKIFSAKRFHHKYKTVSRQSYSIMGILLLTSKTPPLYCGVTKFLHI